MTQASKNIVITAEIYPPDIGGPATYAFELRHELLSCGYTVTLLTLGDASRGADEGVVVIGRKKNVLLRLLQYFFKLKKLSQSADVIYAMGPGVSGLCSVIAGKLTQKRVVVKVTGDRAWEAARLRGSKEGIEEFQLKRHRGWIRVLEAVERFVVRHADAVIVPGNFLKKIVEGWDAKSEKVINIPNAISPLHTASDPMMEEGIRFEERKYIIFAVGRLVPWKGIDDIIAALPKVREKIQDAMLTIVGDGPERERLKGVALEHGVAGIVDFPGSMPHTKLHNYWRRAKVFVLVSGFEGFPHLVLEAWAAGVPVVASDIPAIRDIIINRETGILVPYKDVQAIADALVEVVQNEELARKLRENGRRELAKYRWEKIFTETINLLLYG